MGNLKDSLDLALRKRQALSDSLQRGQQEEQRRQQEELVTRYTALVEPYVGYLHQLGIPETVADLTSVITQRKDKPLVKQIALIKHPGRLDVLTDLIYTESYIDWVEPQTAITPSREYVVKDLLDPNTEIRALGYSVSWGQGTFGQPDEYGSGTYDLWAYNVDLLARRDPIDQDFELLVRTSRGFRDPVVEESICRDIDFAHQIIGDFYLSTVKT